MTQTAITQYDELTHWRCPQLGGPVPFKHCRTTAGGLPCRSLPDCWGGQLGDGLISYLMHNFTENELKTAFAGPREGRLNRLLNALDTALDNTKDTTETTKDE